MNRSLKIIIIVVVVLVGARIYLPYWVTDYVNKVLDDVPGYSGSIDDVDIHLYRGAYRIHKLKMVKTDEEIPVPFLDINYIDLSVQWDALFDGSLVGEIELYQPVVNFVLAISDTTQAEQAGGEADWTKPIKDLMPLSVNKFSVVHGKLTYRDYTSEPNVNISLDSLQLLAKNLSNVTNDDKALPSPIYATATSIGGGKLELKANANLLKAIPDFDANAKFEGVSLPALNDFTEAYAELDFERGTFNLYSEMAVSDGKLTGYIKPVLTDIKLIDFSKDKKKPLQMIWEGIAGFVIEIFENQPKDQFATRVPLKGDLNEIKTSLWPTLGNMLKNAFIQAFQKKTDDSVDFEDIKENSD